jgi:hypothetical protein
MIRKLVSGKILHHLNCLANLQTRWQAHLICPGLIDHKQAIGNNVDRGHSRTHLLLLLFSYYSTVRTCTYIDGYYLCVLGLGLDTCQYVIRRVQYSNLFK